MTIAVAKAFCGKWHLQLSSVGKPNLGTDGTQHTLGGYNCDANANFEKIYPSYLSSFSAQMAMTFSVVDFQRLSR